MRAAADDAMPVIAGCGHQFEVTLPQEALCVDADATRLMQVVLNLLTNAAKYTPRGGRIALTARRDGEHAEITVRDNGIGIPPQSLSTIFEMFSQLTPALDRAQGGLGIGLALVRGLVELHGGSVRADSAGAGQGSTFTVRLPALPPGTATAHASVDGGAGAVGLRILVVDDNADATETMCAMLELHGHRTCSACDGAGALAAASAFAPHVILLDIGLPDMNGYEVARRIRHAGAGKEMARQGDRDRMFMVAATGWGQREDRQRAVDAGFDRHLTKPIDFSGLLALLGEYQAQSR
jgi:CheY-like chemotaxis protein